MFQQSKEKMQAISQSQLRYFSKLHLKKYRDISGCYLISGSNAVRSALESPGIKIRNILLRSDRLDLLKDLAIHVDVNTLLLNEKDFKRISDEQSPQGIAIVAEIQRPLAESMMTDVPLLLYLHQINDPGNLGTIIRTALWFNTRHILLSPESADPYQPKVVRASAGYISHVQLYENVDGHQLSYLRDHGYQLICTMASGGIPLTEASQTLAPKSVILLGSEAHGLPAELTRLCHLTVTIPKSGYGESLNLSVAAALMLYQLQTGKT